MSHSILVVNQLYLDSACGLGASRAFVKPFKLEEVASAVDELLSE